MASGDLRGLDQSETIQSCDGAGWHCLLEKEVYFLQSGGASESRFSSAPPGRIMWVILVVSS